ASREPTLNELTQALNRLNQQNDYILNQIKYLDSYTKDAALNLNKINESINNMDQRLSTLTNNTAVLSKDMGSIKTDVARVKRVLKEAGLDISPELASEVGSTQKGGPGKGQVMIEEPEYVVHAVIPGRAWLKSPRGQIITVAEGDTVGNYGKIL